jgi:hypothetical protein
MWGSPRTAARSPNEKVETLGRGRAKLTTRYKPSNGRVHVRKKIVDTSRVPAIR